MESLLPTAHAVGELLKARNETVAIAESSAGGLIAASLLSLPGASKYFVAGAVVYTLQARRNLMAITDEDMQGLAVVKRALCIITGRAHARTPRHGVGPVRDRCRRSDRQPIWRRGRTYLYRRSRALPARFSTLETEIDDRAQKHAPVCRPAPSRPCTHSCALETDQSGDGCNPTRNIGPAPVHDHCSRHLLRATGIRHCWHAISLLVHRSCSGLCRNALLAARLVVRIRSIVEMFEFGFGVVLMSIFTGVPALLALAGLVFAMRLI